MLDSRALTCVFTPNGVLLTKRYGRQRMRGTNILLALGRLIGYFFALACFDLTWVLAFCYRSAACWGLVLGCAARQSR
jgi:hypothetical protein